jgi:hypothetical protein
MATKRAMLIEFESRLNYPNPAELERIIDTGKGMWSNFWNTTVKDVEVEEVEINGLLYRAVIVERLSD